MNLPPLYHFSPMKNRDSIQSEGLKLYCPVPGTSEVENWARGHNCICLGTSPVYAWNLSGGMQRLVQSEVEGWDLWQVFLSEFDEIAIRTDIGHTIKEVRVFNPISGGKLWWVGERP